MVDHIYDLVKKQQIDLVQNVSFIALSADETSTIDNQSIIVIHVYVTSHWAHQSLMVALVKMESNGATSDSLTKVIMSVLKVNYGLDSQAIASKILCFRADGVAAFQGFKNGVTKQIKEDHAPFAMGMHYCAHHLQLCAKSLSQLDLMASIEALLLHSHSYFAHSPKKVTEFCTFAQLLDTKGLKLLKNVKTR
jgi:hypothetical protein